jgi:hypothetical protein
MRIAFSPYVLTLVGTDQCGVVNGEIHTIKVALRSGVWAVRHKERVQCFQDFPDAHLSQDLSCNLSTKILQDDGWYPGKVDISESIDEICARAGGLVSLAKDSIGVNGPFVLPFGEGLEKNGILLRVDGNANEWQRPYDPRHATSLTIMAGMLVKNMATGKRPGMCWSNPGNSSARRLRQRSSALTPTPECMVPGVASGVATIRCFVLPPQNGTRRFQAWSAWRSCLSRSAIKGQA